MSRAVPVVDAPPTTGNGLAVVADGTVLLDRDLRDSSGARWYWHVRLRGSGTVWVRMARPGLLGGFGPCVLWPNNLEYKWLFDSYAVREEFPIELDRGQSAVLLAATPPYGLAWWTSFVQRIGNHRLQRRTLGISEAGRVVDLFRVASIDVVQTRLVLAARHHACEAMGSRLLEAIIESFLFLRGAGVD